MMAQEDNSPAAPSRAQVLIVDDDVELCDMLREFLAPENFDVAAVHDGAAAIAGLESGQPDLIVLDVMLPGLNGFDVLRRLRAKTAIPVIMLTARGDDVDRIVGLEIGADDYLAKPFNPRELVARIRAILRRVYAADAPARAVSSPLLKAGPLALDTGRLVATLAGNALKLTGAEFRVLEVLVRAEGDIVSREALTESALGRKLQLHDRAIDTHVSNLRRKIGHAGGGDSPIRNIRGAGYLLDLGPDD